MMKRRQLLTVALLLALGPLGPGFGQGTEAVGDLEYVRPDLSGEPPVKLDIWQKEGALGVSFVKPDPNGIEIQLDDGAGSVVVFWEFMDQFQISMPQTKEVADAFRISDPELRAERVAPIVEPLFPLASIPPDSTNIHELIDEYLATLEEAGNWDKIAALSQRMFLDKCPPGTVNYFFTAAKNLFLNGEEAASLDLLNQLIAARPLEESRGNTLNIAAQFMEERLFEPALRLYQVYAAHTDGADGKRIRLICAYLNLELGRQSRSEIYIEEADAMAEGDLRSQATRQLIGGVLAHKEGRWSDSLDQIGFALSALEPKDSMRVIALYYNYLTYQRLEKSEIADSIIREMQLLFSGSSYTSDLVESTPDVPEGS